MKTFTVFFYNFETKVVCGRTLRATAPYDARRRMRAWVNSKGALSSGDRYKIEVCDGRLEINCDNIPETLFTDTFYSIAR